MNTTDSLHLSELAMLAAVLLWFVALPIWAARISERKGHGYWFTLWCGLIFTPILVLVVVACLPDGRNFRACPECMMVIPIVAKRCRFCGEQVGV